MLVKLWMSNSMEVEVDEALYRLSMANEIWDTLHKLYLREKQRRNLRANAGHSRLSRR